MFHMKRERKEMRSPTPLAGIEGPKEVKQGVERQCQQQKRACAGFCGEIAICLAQSVRNEDSGTRRLAIRMRINEFVGLRAGKSKTA